MKKTIKTITKFLILVSIITILVAPVFVSANSLVTCGRAADPANGRPTADPACTFNDIMTLVGTVINFILRDLVIPIAAIMFAYAGFILVTAGGEAASKRTKAKEIFMNTLIGLIIAVACWLIIKTILVILGYDGSLFGL